MNNNYYGQQQNYGYQQPYPQQVYQQEVIVTNGYPNGGYNGYQQPLMYQQQQ